MEKRRYKIAISYLYPIIVMFVTMIISTTLLYIYTYNSQRKSMTEMTSELLTRNMELVESELTGIDEFVEQLTPEVLALPINKMTQSKTEWLSHRNRLQEILMTFCSGSDIVYDAILISEKADIAITKQSSTSLKYFYEGCFNTKSEDFTAKLMNDENEISIFVSGIYRELQGENLLYRKRLDGSYIVIVVDKQALTDKMQNFGGDMTDYIEVRGNNGEIILSLNKTDTQYSLKQPEAKSGSYVTDTSKGKRKVFYKKSLLNYWTYSAVYNEAEIKNATGLLVTAFLIWIVSSGIILLILLWNNSKKNILALEKMAENVPIVRKQNIYQHLAEKMNRSFMLSGELEEKLKQQRQVLINNFILCIMLSDYRSESQAKESLREIGLKFKDKYFGVIIIEETSEDNKRVIDFIYKVCPKYFSFVNAFAMGSGIWTVVVNFGEKNGLHNGFPKYITEKCQGLTDECTIYIGDYYEEFTGISQSYYQAKQLRNHQTHKSSEGIIVYNHELFTFSVTGRFGEKDKNKLQAAISSGDTEAAKMNFQAILKRNIFESELNIVEMKYFLFDVYSFIMSVIVSLPSDNTQLVRKLNEIFSRIEMNTDIEMLQSIKEAIEAAADGMKKYMSAEVQSFSDKIDLYLRENYKNANISVDGVAYEFDISTSYLTSVFKKEKNTTVAERIEELRMQKAKQLLAEGKMPISDIAEYVGYNSPTAFGRAFKKRVGKAPTEYKNSV